MEIEVRNEFLERAIKAYSEPHWKEKNEHLLSELNRNADMIHEMRDRNISAFDGLNGVVKRGAKTPPTDPPIHTEGGDSGEIPHGDITDTHKFRYHELLDDYRKNRLLSQHFNGIEFNAECILDDEREQYNTYIDMYDVLCLDSVRCGRLRDMYYRISNVIDGKRELMFNCDTIIFLAHICKMVVEDGMELSDVLYTYFNNDKVNCDIPVICEEIGRDLEYTNFHLFCIQKFFTAKLHIYLPYYGDTPVLTCGEHKPFLRGHIRNRYSDNGYRTTCKVVFDDYRNKLKRLWHLI